MDEPPVVESHLSDGASESGPVEQVGVEEEVVKPPKKTVSGKVPSTVLGADPSLNYDGVVPVTYVALVSTVILCIDFCALM